MFTQMLRLNIPRKKTLSRKKGERHRGGDMTFTKSKRNHRYLPRSKRGGKRAGGKKQGGGD